MTKTKNITGQFEWKLPPKVIPAFVQGEDAKRLYEEVSKVVSQGLGYNAETQTMWGSNTPMAARVDTLVRPLGIRVATLRDLSRPEIMEMMKDKFYSDTSALVLRTVEDSYSPNKAIIETLVKAVESKEGKLGLPLIATGYDVVKADNEYGWDIAPRKDFSVLHDERLDAKYNGHRFSEVDEDTGLPKFTGNGSRTWYARNQGISRLYLSRYLDLGSYGGSLAVSSEGGRVALVRAEGTAPGNVKKK